ncbi:hypothetical protein ETU09_06765 [Apibacter muscae]|uniref:Porin n=1 Tax=Apibacter muscae TaxID=2509004 RepID=A0A563DCX6_9FLAO|nr:porin [Apibacter muscae]TWP27791.1 hypothetical protein ETU09_06765 [Apibacter muscae]
MKKTLATFFLFVSIISLKAQVPDSVKSANTSTEPGIKTVVDYLLKNKELINIKLDTRFDYQGVFNEKETEQNSLVTQTLKIVADGQITPGIRYMLRQRLNRPQTTLARDNAGYATDFAYLEFDAGKRWTFRVGRQFVIFGTFEYNYNPADVYIPSMIYNDLESYATGLNVSYKVAKQVFNVQVVNSTAPQFADKNYSNKALAGLFLWEGDLFDGVVKTRYGAGLFQHDGSKYFGWYTLGNQLNINKFSTNLDWYIGTRTMDFNSVVPIYNEGDLREVRDQAASVYMKYDLGKFQPILRGTWSHRKDLQSGGSYSITGIQGGLEYYPFKGNPLLENLRLHAIYGYNNTDYSGDFKSLDSFDTNYVIVGMRWLFKIM